MWFCWISRLSAVVQAAFPQCALSKSTRCIKQKETFQLFIFTGLQGLVLLTTTSQGLDGKHGPCWVSSSSLWTDLKNKIPERKVQPIHVDLPLVTGSSRAHWLLPLHGSRSDIGQTENVNNKINKNPHRICLLFQEGYWCLFEQSYCNNLFSWSLYVVFYYYCCSSITGRCPNVRNYIL